MISIVTRACFACYALYHGLETSDRHRDWYTGILVYWYTHMELFCIMS